MYKLALANITGNIPCVCLIAGGIYLIERDFFGTGLFLLIMSVITVTHYKQTSGQSGEKDNE